MCSSKSQNSSELVISTKTNSNSFHLYLDPECASTKITVSFVSVSAVTSNTKTSFSDPEQVKMMSMSVPAFMQQEVKLKPKPMSNADVE